MKLITLMIILGLCANLCYGADVVPTSQFSALASLWLNSTATKVYSAANETDAMIWNQYAQTPVPASPSGVTPQSVIFGPGTTNDTIYVYGVTVTDGGQIDKIYKRTLNATIIGWGNDTTMSCVIKDETILSAIPVSDGRATVAPGYLAIFTTGSDGTYDQVYLTLVSGNTATMFQLTSVTDSTATCTSFTLGNIWYDIGAGAFFYTYSKWVYSSTCADIRKLTEDTLRTLSTPTSTHTIYLGGHYLNGTAYWPAPGLAMAPIAAANQPTSIIGGGDNWLNSSNIYVVYKDSTVTPPVIYYSKTAKATNTISGGAFSVLVSDDATPNAVKTYTPLSVWASNFTHGIAVACANQTDGSTYNYPIWNFLNGTTTATDSGLSYTGVTNSDGGAVGLSGWMLSTGYNLVGGWLTSTSNTYSYQMGTFYANGTVNQTASTLGNIQGPLQFFQDANGAMWVGWTDIDTGNGLTYAGYLAKLQGQTNVVVGADTLSIALAVVAFLLASIVAY